MTAVANDNACRTQENAISRFMRTFLQNRRNARALRVMLEMNDHLLRDIGLSRFDIQSALKARVSESCGARLARVVEENRKAQVRHERAVSEIRPHTADEQARLAP